MRRISLASSIFAAVLAPSLLAACGDDGGSTTQRPDARPTPDALPIDAPLADGPTGDTPIDGPVTAAGSGKVWIAGDWVVDNIQKVGALPGNSAAPVTVANIVTMPGTQATTDKLPASNTGFFDVSADGTKVVFIADTTVAGRFDLFSANADGTGLVTVYQAPATVDISSVSISPDGTKIAFFADGVLDGMQDIYVIPNAANGTPVKATPDRAANLDTLDAFRVFTWSKDSKYLSLSGRFTDAAYDEVVVYDSVANSRAVVLPRADILVDTGTTRGVRGSILFDATNHVFFRAMVDAGATPQFKLFTAAADGTGRAVLALPARGDGTASQPGSFAISPDGTKVVFSADAPTATAYEVYAAPTTLAAPVRLTGGAVPAGGNADFNAPPAFSPDGTLVAFYGDLTTLDANEPYVATVATAASAKRIAHSAVAAADAQGIAFAGNDRVFFLMDYDTDNIFTLYAASPLTADGTPGKMFDPPGAGDVSELKTRP